MIRVRHRGQLLKHNELNEIANNYILTKHAKEMIDKRCPNLNIKHLIRINSLISNIKVLMMKKNKIGLNKQK